MCGRQAVYKLSFAESVFGESGMVTLNSFLQPCYNSLEIVLAVYANLRLCLSCMIVPRLLVL